MIRTTTLALALLLGAGSAQSQAAEGRLQKIAASGAITIAYRADATPFSFTDDKKQVVGSTIDLCQRVVQSIREQLKLKELKVNWHLVTTATRFDAISQGRADMECGSSTVTLSRLKQVDFSSYIFAESTGLLVKTATGMRSVANLWGKTVAVIAGTTNESVMRAQVNRRKLDTKVVPYRTQQEAFAALEAGKADAFASDKLLLIGVASKARDPGQYNLLPDDLSFEPYGIALPRGDADFRLAVNTGLARIYSSGEITGIFRHWFGGFGEPSAVIGVLYLLGAIPD